MKNFTRLLVLVLVCVFAFALVGCGNDDRIVALEKAMNKNAVYTNNNDKMFDC